MPHEIRVERIADLGDLHDGRKTIQPKSRESREFSVAASDALKHPLLFFDQEAVQIIADAFAAVSMAKR